MRDENGPVTPPARERGALAAAPLALAYLLLPLSWTAARFAPALRLPDWIPSGWPWLALAGTGLLGAVAALATRRSPLRRVPVWMALLAAACGALLALCLIKLSLPRLQEPFFPVERFWLLALPETAPLIFTLLAGAWAVSFGAPARVWFRRFGTLLGALVVADVVFASVQAGFPVPGGVLLDGGLAERHAFLLGLALLLGVDDADRKGRFPSWQSMTIMAGLLGCGSPAAQLAAGSAYLFLSRERIEARVGFALACAGGVAGPLYGGTPLHMDGRMQVYMTWMAGLESFAAHPLALLKGFGPWPLDFHLPEQAATALGMPDMNFSLPPRAVPSFWMRAALVWGALPPLALLLTSMALTAVTPGRAMAGIMALAMAQGVVFPLLYDGSAALPLCLAVVCLLAEGVRVLRAEADSSPDSPPASVSEPTSRPDQESGTGV
jgi:hypothetical protein